MPQNSIALSWQTARFFYFGTEITRKEVIRLLFLSHIPTRCTNENPIFD